MELDFLNVQNIVDLLSTILFYIVLTTVTVSTIAGAIYGYLLWKKVKTRHEKALEWVYLEVSLPRDNEVKIDAAEQMFSSFTSLEAAEGFLKFRKIPESISFEIVALSEDIRFYIGLPHELKDMAEKQIDEWQNRQ